MFILRQQLKTTRRSYLILFLLFDFIPLHVL